MSPERNSGSSKTTITEQHSNGALGIMERVRLVVTTLIGLATLLGIVLGFWAALNKSAQAAANASFSELHATDRVCMSRLDSTDSRINHLIDIVNIQATMQIEPKGSFEYNRAVARLRDMRRVFN